MLKKFEFGKEAVDYITSSLEDLRDMNKALAQYLLELPLEEGNVISYLSAESNKEARLDFKTGGIITDETTKKHVIETNGQHILMESVPNQNTRQKLIELIFAFMQESNNNYLIMENTNFSPDAPFVSKIKEPFFTYKNSLFHFISSHYSNEKTIDTVVRIAGSGWLYTGILTYSNQHLNIDQGEEVSKETLKMFAENAQHIFVSAYDGESELIWSKKK